VTSLPSGKALAAMADEVCAPEPRSQPLAGGRRMQLRYGFNEIDDWWAFSLGDQRERIRRRLRLMDTQVIRIFVFDQPVPDPVTQWDMFVAYVQGVLDAGAKPMVTFAKFHPPYDNAIHIRSFVSRCADVVWGCIEHWGGDEVAGWYWCIWNEPNNLIIGGDLTFPQYRRIYQDVATAVLELLAPHLRGRKARIGGPSIDGTHRSYWMDWIVRLITEVDDRLVGFVSWHRYGDWRPAVPSATLFGVEMYGSPDVPAATAFESLLMAQLPDYEARARGVARLLHGRDILNVCGELNTVAHHENYYTLGLNQNVFGAAYYASALIHLLRGGADLEMRWTATSRRWTPTNDDAYGVMDMDGTPTPACLAKQLFVQHVRHGDWVRFPAHRLESPHLDAVVAWDDNGRRSVVFVQTANKPCMLRIADWGDDLGDCAGDFTEWLRIDRTTDGRVVREPFDGAVRLDGYGIAVVTNTATDVD
jgi:hypothetical protein